MIDLISSTLQLVALNFVAGSVYQMIRGGTIVATFVLSILVLGMQVKRKQIAGSLLALIGIIIVGISSVTFS